MRRREFMTIVSGATVFAPLRRFAQETGRTYRLGVLGFTSRRAPARPVAAHQLPERLVWDDLKVSDPNITCMGFNEAAGFHPSQQRCGDVAPCRTRAAVRAGAPHPSDLPPRSGKHGRQWARRGLSRKAPRVGWTDGHNMRVDVHWAATYASEIRRRVAALVALTPDRRARRAAVAATFFLCAPLAVAEEGAIQGPDPVRPSADGLPLVAAQSWTLPQVIVRHLL
jgi:hypothetical protein